MKEKWLLVCNNMIIGTCVASSYDEASEIFKNGASYYDWAYSAILSEADYMHELELNSLENQSYEG